MNAGWGMQRRRATVPRVLAPSIPLLAFKAACSRPQVRGTKRQKNE